MEKPTIFICYHQKDGKWKDDLVSQLNVLMQQYEYWTDDKIEAGEDWLKNAQNALGSACVAFFLVSSDSLNPQFILREDVRDLITRCKEGLRVIPLIVRDCGWEQVEWLVRLQPRPEDKVALRKKKPADVETELRKIVTEVAQIIKRLAAVDPTAGARSPGERQDRARQEDSPTPTDAETRKAREQLRLQLETAAKTDPEFARTLYEMGSKHMSKDQATVGLAKEYQESPAKQPVKGSRKTTGLKDDAKKNE